MQRATHFGVVIDRASGKVRRVFNPDFDFQFAGHHVDDAVEFMLRIKKKDFGVDIKPNSMTLEQVQRIMAVFGK